MSEKKILKPVALAVGAVLAGSFAIGGAVNAETIENPFSMSTLSTGYMLGEGEGSCGGDKEGKKDAEGSCGEGSCGGDKEGDSSDKDSEGSCGGDKEGDSSDKDSEGSCGGDKADEGSCGGDKDKDAEEEE